MTVHASTVRDLPDALHDEGLFFERLAGRRPAVFLDYDGVLTPIVDRPEDAVISKGMRTTVRALARRCPVCVVSGRDPQTPVHRVQLGGLASAGSHSQPLGSPSVAPTVAGLAAHRKTLIACLSLDPPMGSVTSARLALAVDSVTGRN